jgi:predicted MFS family arabinose efflux permease
MLIMLISWFVVFVILALLNNDYGLLRLGRIYAAIAAAVVLFGYWFVHTGRLAKTFRKV